MNVPFHFQVHTVLGVTIKFHEITIRNLISILILLCAFFLSRSFSFVGYHINYTWTFEPTFEPKPWRYNNSQASPSLLDQLV